MKPALASSAGFWVVADAFRAAGDAAFELTRASNYSGEVRVPCVFLYFRCIELLLKSVLIFHGVSEQEIAHKLGHRVADLLGRADSFQRFKSVPFSASDRQVISEFSNSYAEKWFEYPEDLLAPYPDLAILKNLAARLCLEIRRYEDEKPTPPT